jgi:hypothetical protein
VSDDQSPPVEIIYAGDPNEGGAGGLYNMLVPDGFKRGRLLMPFLGGFDSLWDVGRFRDMWAEVDTEGKLHYRVYTRNGGGNREDQEEAIARMRAHPLYERDEDDTFDSTYASFWFRVQDEFTSTIRQIAVPTMDMAERWKTLIAALGEVGST